MSRFLIFGANYWPEPIGCAQYTTPYAEALADAGHEVTVIAAYPHYPSWSREEVRARPTRERLHGVSVVRVPIAVARPATTAGRGALEASYGAAAVAASAAVRGIDAIIGVVPFLSAGLAAATVGATRRKPHAILLQDMMSAAARQGGMPGGGRASGAIAKVEKLVLRGAKVGVVARGFEGPARALDAREIEYLPNFSLLGEPRATRDFTRRRLAIPTDAFVAMYSGNLGYKQDFGSVIDAAAAVRASAPDIVFVIVGEGSQRDWIAEEVERRGLDNLLLRPLQSDEELPAVLQSADVLLAPQRPTDVDMTVPSKLTAYLSAGRPVIAGASPASETARIVEESGGGVLVAPSDGDALAGAILELRARPDVLEGLGAAGRAYAASAFARAPALRRFVTFAESLLSAQTRR